ncbi:YfdQ family protein [Erwinia mallotivora]|uniref:YfdQ family protein n=1 Tax=Erwinia mallotivora TaxID=69222 RepID=UPI0021C0DFB5|nr:YfdQ family protein [Erwinia mallotivora]
MKDVEGTLVSEIRDLTAISLVPKTEIPAIALPDKYSLESLESHQLSPSRIRQRVRLISPASLIAYITKFKDERSVVFADKENTKIVAVLDYHESASAANWGEHKASYDCPFSDDWKEWAGRDKKAMNQTDFAEFLENHIQNVAPVSDDYKGPSGTALLEMVLAFQETRKAEFKSVRRLQDGTYQMAYSDEKSGAGNTSLPEKISLAISPFHNGSPYQVDARIRYRLRDAQLVLWYELIEPQKIVEHAFQEIIVDLENQLADVPVFEGSV